MELTEENKNYLNRISGYADWHSDHGVLLVCDSKFEHMFDWWIEKYSKYNDISICLIDAGLSDNFIKSHSDIMIKKINTPDTMKNKHMWKPFILRLSPFKKTVYIDLDCEIRGPIVKLFEYSDFAMAKDVSNSFDEKNDRDPFDCSVIVYENSSKTIDLWCDAMIEDSKVNFTTSGDQQVFNRSSFPCNEIDPKYNWVRLQGPNPEATIIHRAKEESCIK